jgi:hypothetical protein
MNIHSGEFPFSQVQFRYRHPLPGSAFENWVNQELSLGIGETHPWDKNIDFEINDVSVNFRKLSLYGHDPLQLSMVLQSIAKRQGINLLRSQREGIIQFGELTRQLSPNQELENDLLLEQFFNVFSDIFFNSALRGLCKVQFYPQISPQKHGECISPYHSLLGRQRIPENFASLINLKSRVTDARFQNMNPAKRPRKYLGTLLHEMLHAFLGIYICDGKRCSSRVECRNRYLTAIGRKGHKEEWQWAALEFEKAALALLGEELDIHRSLSFRK